MFYLFDQADGSRGQATLANQRAEHVEMWTLLGDPAMQLPPLPNDMDTNTQSKQERK